MLVAIPVTALVRGGDEESETAPLPPLGPSKVDRGLEVAYRVPVGWDEAQEASALRLHSGDRTVQLVVASPAPADRAGRLLDDTLAAIRDGYEAVDVRPGSGKAVGGLEAKGAVIAAQTREGESLRILVAVAEGKSRAYLVEVFTAGGAPDARLLETQVALNALSLRG